MLICLVITFSVVVRGPGVRWVCGTSRVNKFYDCRETYSAPLSNPEGVYVRGMNLE